ALKHMTGMMYVLGEIPDYEPLPHQTVAARAQAAGVAELEWVYDHPLQRAGPSFLRVPFFGYAQPDPAPIRAMLTHPAAVSGLSDGGAHCRMICDASYPTFLLTHWARDRTRGDTLPVEQVVKMQSADTAALYGMTDRGVLAEGKKADVNVID